MRWFRRKHKTEVVNPKPVCARWTHSSVRCEFCVHVDHSSLYVWEGYHELRECIYEYHGEYPPMNSIIDKEGRLLVSPMGTSCSYFMAGVW